MVFTAFLSHCCGDSGKKKKSKTFVEGRGKFNMLYFVDLRCTACYLDIFIYYTLISTEAIFIHIILVQYCL